MTACRGRSLPSLIRASMSDTLAPWSGPFSLSLVMVSALSVPFFFCMATTLCHRQHYNSYMHAREA